MGGLAISFLTTVSILKIIGIVLESCISVLSTRGLFYSVILFGISLIVVIISFWKKHKPNHCSLPERVDLINYYSVDI